MNIDQSEALHTSVEPSAKRGKGYKFCEKKGYWIAFCSARHPITKRSFGLRRKAASREDAILKHKELKKKIDIRRYEVMEPSWGRVVAEFVEHCRKQRVSDPTVQDYGGTLLRYTGDRWRNKKVRDIRDWHVADLMAEGRVKDLSPGRQEKIRCLLNRVFEFALSKGYLQKNPCTLKAISVPERPLGVLNEAQASQLLRSAQDTENPWFSIWAAAIYTGMRSGELYALRWEDVDFTSMKICVSRSWSPKSGIKGTKSNRYRIIPIAPDFKNLLLELKAKSGDSPYVLPRLGGWKNQKQAAILKDFLRSIGLPPVRFHDLRATWVTMLINLGMPIGKIQVAGGWKDLKSMEPYIRASGITVAGLTDCLNFNIGRA